MIYQVQYTLQILVDLIYRIDIKIFDLYNILLQILVDLIYRIDIKIFDLVRSQLNQLIKNDLSTINFKTRQLKITRRRSVSSILGNQKKNERRRSFQKPRKRKKVPCYCNNCNGKLVLERTKLLHETGGETNDSNEDESSEDEALSIIQETSEQDITENIELP
ncbi:uncharacterized protein OCT59_013883 [Rhizophagus irregularis]|uniref:uncharacterized protein n=1 Tax=Rhizophagus irregularis TaxID=588596 RepID=UPI00332FA814|nr:hypothetical protein OCT59_013883 [Rhizophagus irregularis]